MLAVERAVRSGLIVVAAAGNYGRNPDTGSVGYAGITSPGNAPSAITVGAYDSHGTVSRFDDTIPDTRRAARAGTTATPSLTSWRRARRSWRPLRRAARCSARIPAGGSRDVEGAPSYFRLSGTSMATAVTSGAVALMLEASRDRTTRAI